MTTPYIPQEPGNPILAKDWNDMQTQIRDHVTLHTHSGGENGVKLTGDAIDPGASLTVSGLQSKQLTVQGQATVKGNLGIGTLTPSQRLEVAGAAQIHNALKVNTADNPTLISSVWSGFPDAAPNQSEISNDVGTYKCMMLVGNRASGTRTVGVWDRLEVNGTQIVSGRVGIGASNPQDLLHVRAPAGNIGLTIDSGEADGDIAAIRFAGNGKIRSWIAANARTGRIFMGNPTANEALTISGGNVGIRRSQPARALQIGGDRDGIGIDPSDGSPNAGYIRFGDDTGWKLHFGRALEKGSQALNTGTTGVLMTIQDNGNVGIGTTAPSQRLEVAGGLCVRGGPIIPMFGNHAAAGIQFPSDVAGGSGDSAWMRYAPVAGEACKLQIGVDNDPDDHLALYQYGRDRLVINQGMIRVDGTGSTAGQLALRVYSQSFPNQWNGRIVSGGDGNLVVLGDFNGVAVVGAHNNALNGWADLSINAGGKVVIGSWTPDASSALTVDGRTTFRIPGGSGGWDRLVVTTTGEWGDVGGQYVTLGAGGTAGIMLSNPHITWRDGRSSIRYGRTNSQAGETYWDVGLRSDGSFSLIPLDNGGDGSEKLKIGRDGGVQLRNALRVNMADNPTLISSGWSGFPDTASNRSEIANDIGTYKCMMLVGNKSSGIRKVGVWDRLEVNGTQLITGNLGTRGHDPNGGGIYPPGWGGGLHTWDIIAEATIIYGNNCFKNSTLRVKENIRPLTGCLALIDRLTPVQYDHREHTDSRNNYGFIAEEVREVAPDVVLPASPEHPAFFAGSLSQDSLLGLAIAGIQELGRKVARLERELHGKSSASDPAGATRDGLEILSEQSHANKDGVLEDYVAVRFTSSDDLGPRDVVRYLRLPYGLDRHEYLMGELKRWKHSLTA